MIVYIRNVTNAVVTLGAGLPSLARYSVVSYSSNVLTDNQILSLHRAAESHLITYSTDEDPSVNDAVEHSTIQSERALKGSQDFADTGAIKPAVVDIDGGEAKLTNDALGVLTGGGSDNNPDHTPLGITDIWNSATNTFEFAEAGLTVDDQIQLRIDLGVTPGAVPHTHKLELRFYDAPGGSGGAGVNVFTLAKTLPESGQGAGVEHDHLPEIRFFLGAILFPAGSMEIVLTTTTSVVILVRGWNMLIHRIGVI